MRLYFRDYGDPLAPGRPLLCLPGLTRNSRDFHDLALHHAPRRRVVCLDTRGRGRSAYDLDWRHYRPEVYVGDILQLLAATNLHGAVVCGTSMGGLLAMGLSVAAPSALAGVILNDVGPVVDTTATQRIIATLAAMHEFPDLTSAIAHLKSLLPNMGYSSDAQWERFVRATYREEETGVWVPDWDPKIVEPLKAAPNQALDLWPYYRALGKFPVLAIRGGLSDVLTPETFAQMKQEKPDLRQVTLPAIGHAPSLDEPQSEQAIDDFLAEIDSR